MPSSKTPLRVAPAPETPLVSALGCAVRLDDAALPDDARALIARAWSGAASRAEDPLPSVHITVSIPGGSSVEHMLSSLSQKVTLAAIEARRGELWMLHAAGLADSSGNVIALIGPSGQGKTTAARTLASQFAYVSDETVGIEADGAVHAYRKPLSIIDGSQHVKTQRSPDELGLKPLPAAPLKLAAIVLLDRVVDGPEEAITEPCDLGEALPDLIAQSSYLGSLPSPLRTIAAHAAAVGGIHRIRYKEAAALAPALAALFRVSSPRRAREPIYNATPVADGLGLYRAGYLDAILLDFPERVALLQPDINGGSTFRLITGIGPELWRAAKGATLTELIAAAEEAHGTPPGGSAEVLVDNAVAELLDQSVLATEPTWRIRKDVAVTGEGGHFAALSLADLSNPTPVVLEGSAAIIWEILSTSRGITRSGLVDEIAVRDGVSAEELAATVSEFLTILEDAGLAERVLP